MIFHRAASPAPAQRDKDAAMRITALFFAILALWGCSKPAWHMTDISGAMPRLDFHMSANGRPVTAADFRGKVVALYFGYTHCPDVCPTTLANLTDILGKVNSPDVRVLFVTVDPDVSEKEKESIYGLLSKVEMGSRVTDIQARADRRQPPKMEDGATMAVEVQRNNLGIAWKRVGVGTRVHKVG